MSVSTLTRNSRRGAANHVNAEASLSGGVVRRNSDVSCSAAKDTHAMVAASDRENRETVINRNLHRTYLHHTR